MNVEDKFLSPQFIDQKFRSILKGKDTYLSNWYQRKDLPEQLGSKKEFTRAIGIKERAYLSNWDQRKTVLVFGTSRTAEGSVGNVYHGNVTWCAGAALCETISGTLRW